jgi:hypothetical protein
MVLGCHLERHAKSPRGETYRLAIDRRGILLGNGRLAFVALPIGWIVHRLRYPGQWWLTVARPPHRRDLMKWQPPNVRSYGPYDEDHARQELTRLVALIESGDWSDGRIADESNPDEPRS